MSKNLPELFDNKKGKMNSILPSWMNKRNNKTSKQYEEIEDVEELFETIEDCGNTYNVSRKSQIYQDSRDVNNLDTNEYSNSTIISKNQPYQKITNKKSTTKSIKTISAQGEVKEVTQKDEEVREHIIVGNINDAFNNSFDSYFNDEFSGNFFGGNDMFESDNSLNSGGFNSKQTNSSCQKRLFENAIDITEVKETKTTQPQIEGNQMRYLPYSEENLENEDTSLFRQAMQSAPDKIKQGLCQYDLEDVSIKCFPANVILKEEIISNKNKLKECLKNIVFICTNSDKIPKIRKFENHVGVCIPFDADGYCFLNILRESSLPLNIIIDKDNDSRHFDEYFIYNLMCNHNVVLINRQESNKRSSNDNSEIISLKKYKN